MFKIGSIITADTIAKIVYKTFMELPDVTNAQTKTEVPTFRELQGLGKPLQDTRGELVNKLAQLTDNDKDIAKEKCQLEEAEDEISQKDIRARFEKSWRWESCNLIEAASANKEALRGQINTIKETIGHILNFHSHSNWTHTRESMVGVWVEWD